MLRLLTRPRWLVRHSVVIGLCVAFVFLGRWQLHRGEATQGTIQNYGYAIEWPLFGVAVMFAWWKMLSDELHPEGKGKNKGKAKKVSPWRIPEQPTVRPLSMPSTAVTAVPVVESAPVVARLGPLDENRSGFPQPLTTAAIDPDDLEVIRYNEWLAQFTKSPVDGYRARAPR